MENKICKKCNQNFSIEQEDLDFYEKIKVPSPTLCPECRLVRRMLFRNERTWYRRTCDATGKSILSMYAPDSPYTVYEQNYWKSDSWDPLTFNREYDFSRGFFEQFNDLMKVVPMPNLIQKNNTNSDFSNYTLNLKNGFFCVSVDGGEDCAYCFTGNIRIKNCFDLHQSMDDEYCYECTDCIKCNRLAFGQNCEGCVSSMFLYDCRNCSDCFGCVGQRNKQYMIFNEQYSKEEYREKMKELWGGSHQALILARERFNALKLTIPRKFANIQKSENVSGDDILNARNCSHCTVVRNDVENLKYVYRGWDHAKDGMDAFVIWNGSEVFYEVVSCSGQNLIGSAYIWGGFNIQYSYNCFDCNNIFGCIGLRSKSYCIFNKQYAKEEYEVIVEKIIVDMKVRGEYGEFFPRDVIPFAYNETVAQDYFPKTKEEIIASGFRFHDPEQKNYTVTLPFEKIPDSILEIPDTVTGEVVSCEHGGKCTEQCATAFRITADELAFYRNMKLPLPRLCPSCRHYGRVKLKNPIRLWHRVCMSSGCQNEFETPYAPEAPYIVYCEDCYQREIL